MDVGSSRTQEQDRTRDPEGAEARPAGEAGVAAGEADARRRYAVIGLSNRGVASFVRPLLGLDGAAEEHLGYGTDADGFAAHGRLVAVLDADAVRAEAFTRGILPAGHPEVPVYGPDEVDRMLEEVAPDAVIVTSPDSTHATYILAALAAGIDVISEKPMVTTAADARRVLAAEQASPASLRVTHNLRYTARHRAIAQLLADGEVGRILHVSLEYHVDVRHGASYFLRWNRRRERSGGLSIHKSTHHLDLIAWWLRAEPRTVYAVGGRDFYGPDSPHRPAGARTPQEIRDADPYQRAQQGSGTFPDDASAARRGMFDLPYEVQYPAGRDLTLYDDEIDIEDRFAALITYDSGATAAYSIDFSSPWEGYRATITGTHGAIEVFTGRTPEGNPLPGSGELIVRPLFAPARSVPVGAAAGGHDGADPMMRRDLFIGPDEESLRLHLGASARAGALAVATGEGIWRSIAQQEIVDVQALLAP